MGGVKQLVVRMLDVILSPFVFCSALLLKRVRGLGLERMRISRAIFIRLGVLPINDHYYEPFTSAKHLRRQLERERNLPGIDWNIPGQLELLSSMQFTDELSTWNDGIQGEDFAFGNGSFEAGDAEYLYQLIRLKKPRRFYEIGSGNSTKIALRAIKRNAGEDSSYRCEHLSIEPYEAPWLEAAGIKTLRNRVEMSDLETFSKLGRDDILFIDSSHIIRPQGDVLFEYLEILPSLQPGVIVHIHDIFSPRDYPEEWILHKMLLWNEQYLLEAFLQGNRDWEILGALNLLRHHHFARLREVCPYVSEDTEPGSLYMRKLR